jgi:hypothetical protein
MIKSFGEKLAKIPLEKNKQGTRVGQATDGSAYFLQLKRRGFGS